MNQRIQALVFPQYFGPSIHPFGGALLWFGELNCLAGPFVSGSPISSFEKIANRARERNHPLARLFNATSASFQRSCKLLLQASGELKPLLNGPIKVVAGIGPGNPKTYRQIREEFSSLVDAVVRVGANDELMRVGSCELIWRCFEYFLELGQSPDGVIDALEEEDTEAPRLFAECVTKHYLWLSAKGSGLVTNDPTTVEMYASLGHALLDKGDQSLLKVPAPLARHQIASRIFENTVGDFCPPITRASSEKYLRTLREKAEAIDAAKRKCHLIADRLLNDTKDIEVFRMLLAQGVKDLRAEVQEIAEVDSATLRSAVQKLSEDRGLWVGLSSFVAGLAGVAPPVAFALAAITVTASMATTSIGEMRKRSKLLQTSDWRFIYQLR